MIEVDGVKIQPYGRHVIVERLPNPAETRSGIALPENQKETNYFCRLLDKGHGEWFTNGEYKPATTAEIGDIVIVRQFEGRKVISSNKNILLCEGLCIEARVKQDA